MGIRKLFLITCMLALAPSFVYATGTVRINEVAWMGTKANARAEWIELFNASNSSVHLKGWALTQTLAKGTPDIHFSGKDSISSHGYFLLERTRSTSIAGVTADKVYTGGMKNTGETLILINAASTTVDKVVGGKDWCGIGGNNSTKQTAQRTALGWITATGTPRAINTTVGVVPSCATKHSKGVADISVSTATTATSSIAVATTSTSIPVISGHHGPPEFEPIQPVFISIGKDISTVAGADTRFSAIVTDKSGRQYTSAVVTWTFGDGSRVTGTNVFKDYNAPGTYAVVANAVEGLGSGEDDLIATVHDAHVSIPKISVRGITIQNNTPYRLDMSLWRLSAGTTTFAFPPRTVILPNTRVLFPMDITKLPVTNDTALLYPNGKEVARYNFAGDVVKHGVLSKPRKLSLVSASYNIVQGGESEGTRRVVQQHIIRSHNTTLVYDTKALIAPAPTISIVGAGAPVADAFSGIRTTSAVRMPESFATSSQTSFTHRFLSVPWTFPLLLILIFSVTGLVLL